MHMFSLASVLCIGWPSLIICFLQFIPLSSSTQRFVHPFHRFRASSDCASVFYFENMYSSIFNSYPQMLHCVPVCYLLRFLFFLFLTKSFKQTNLKHQFCKLVLLWPILRQWISSLQFLCFYYCSFIFVYFLFIMFFVLFSKYFIHTTTIY